jgi:hypothetical protein
MTYSRRLSEADLIQGVAQGVGKDFMLFVAVYGVRSLKGPSYRGPD